MRSAMIIAVLSWASVAQHAVAAPPVAPSAAEGASSAGARAPTGEPRAPTVQQRVDELVERMNQALLTKAEVATTLEALQRMQEELSHLKQALERQQAIGRGYDAMRVDSSELHRRLDELEQRITALEFRRSSAGGGDLDTGLATISSDERFRLVIGGLLQAEYGDRSFSTELLAPLDPWGDRTWEGREAGSRPFGRDRSEFALRRARVVLDGHVGSPRARYYVALQYGTMDRQGILDAWAELELHRLVRLRLGLMKQPYGRQFALRAPDLLFVERGPATLAFHPGRDVGVLISGEVFPDERYGQLSYSLGMFNGDPAAVRDDARFSKIDGEFLYGARIAYAPLGRLSPFETDRVIERRPRLEVATSVFYTRPPTDAPARADATDPEEIARLLDRNADGVVDRVDTLGLGGELTAHYRGVGWQSELFYRQERLEEAQEERRYWGAYSQLGVHLPWDIEVAGRYSFWDHRRYGESVRRVVPDRTHEAAGVAALLLWAGRVKLLGQYGYRWHRDLQGAWAGVRHVGEHQTFVSTQLVF